MATTSRARATAPPTTGPAMTAAEGDEGFDVFGEDVGDEAWVVEEAVDGEPVKPFNLEPDMTSRSGSRKRAERLEQQSLALSAFLSGPQQ